MKNAGFRKSGTAICNKLLKTAIRVLALTHKVTSRSGYQPPGPRKVAKYPSLGVSGIRVKELRQTRSTEQDAPLSAPIAACISNCQQTVAIANSNTRNFDFLSTLISKAARAG
jgi:hypothetical protein